MNYEDKALLSYLGKEKGFEWYKKSFAKHDAKNGKFAWSWSFWAFVGGGWYFIYRKMFVEGICLLALGVFLAFTHPAMMLSLKISMGGIGPYMFYVRYRGAKNEVESMYKKESGRLEALKERGGYFQQGIYLAVGVYLLGLGYIAYAYATAG
ncbi:DUF2628 domain-containing protein [uncultured Ilyobacter sp.]|uniref:DUF2628 domain-containing protein n=1 Tax=uncultured Ilyobacter sp. TaxID=544433 RepID=UPI002AA73721|nr:DUF2628 domain-containing protein [uncultured Ilyobacter sp.]